jgi:hypothetical protein
MPLIPIRGCNVSGMYLCIYMYVSMVQEFYMKEISSMNFSQHAEVFYFYGHALHIIIITLALSL